jgi:hypothetical protein
MTETRLRPTADFGPGPHRFRDPFLPGPHAHRLDRLMPGYKPDQPLVDFYRRAHFQGDPAADALVAWMHSFGQREGRALVERVLERGLDDVLDPPAPLRAFFEEIEVVPAWLDRRTLARACRVPRRATLGHNYVLFSISLLAGYLSSGVTKTLAATGELEAMAPRRVAETSQFIESLYASRTLGRDSAGFKNTIRVRLMHAFVRDRLLRSGWDTSRWGMPINQADMAGTVLSFSVTYLMGLRMLGFVVSRAERAALIHFWRYTGRLLGVSEALLPATERESMRLLWLVAATQTGPDDEGRALARALLGVPDAYLHEGLLGEMLARFDARFCAGFTRSFIGDSAADDLGLPDTPWKYAFLAFATANLAGEVLRLAFPVAGRIPSRLGRVLADFRRRSLLEGRSATFEPRTVAAHARHPAAR